ncbi:Beta-galactosidase 9 [Capsicum chinense]|nr:Beta-galactosidase 9 [Capsicum chinense]
MTLKEPLGVWGDKNFTSKGILDLLNVTKYQSDYLRHLIRIYISDDDISFWKQKDDSPTIDIDSMHDFVRIFVNGKFFLSQLLQSELGVLVLGFRSDTRPSLPGNSRVVKLL